MTIYLNIDKQIDFIQLINNYDENDNKSDIDDEKYQISIDKVNIGYDAYFEEEKIIETAINKSKMIKLKQSIKYLLSKGGKYATIEYIASFLYFNKFSDQEEIGEFISALETSILSQEKHKELLTAYMKFINFHKIPFVTAMRIFLTDSGFRLPKEAQKIDRLS